MLLPGKYRHRFHCVVPVAVSGLPYFDTVGESQIGSRPQVVTPPVLCGGWCGVWSPSTHNGRKRRRR
ncbi:MAG: hypothetical protein JOZ18_02135 [Chloroflexi bacterium]|nr:hypothetical protein [Chloroflexota bacterium]